MFYVCLCLSVSVSVSVLKNVVCMCVCVCFVSVWLCALTHSLLSAVIVIDIVVS